MHVRAVQGMIMFRPSTVTDIFTFSKQRAIQLLSAMFFLPARKSAPEARLESYVNRCHISAGTHKFKSAVLVSGAPFQKSTLKKLEHNLPCK